MALGEPAPASQISPTASQETGVPTNAAPIVASRYAGGDGHATLVPLPLGRYRVIVLCDQGTAGSAALVIAGNAHPLQEFTIKLSDK